MKLLLVLFLLAAPSFAQKPSQGKVRLYVTAGEAGVYEGLQQRAADLEESAKDIRRYLGGGDWTEATDKEEEADIRIVVLGRRRDPDRGIALGYSLDAGAYKTEDEIYDVSVDGTAMGGASRGARSSTDATAQKRQATYEDLAEQFARSLDVFCQSNYDRIVRQRE